MLKKINAASEDILAYEAVGMITKEDYVNVLEPDFERFSKAGKKLRFLFQLGPKFAGYTAAAAWEDLKVGITSYGLLERCAIVTDLKSLKAMTTFFGGFVPCAVQSFKNEELNDALAWLNSGEIALDYQLDLVQGILRLEIKAPISSLLFSPLTSLVDSHIQRHGDLNGILIHARTFPGWEDFGSFVSHLKFVRDHHQHIRKVALVTDGALPRVMRTLAKHFTKAEVRVFESEQIEEAKAWLEEKIAVLHTMSRENSAVESELL